MGLILLGSSTCGIEDWIDITAQQKEVLVGGSDFPTTYLIPKTDAAPSWITGNNLSVAVRITEKEPVPAFHCILGSPVVSTSANFHGGDELNSFEAVQGVLAGVVDFIVEGPIDSSAKPSKIVDILTNEVIRG